MTFFCGSAVVATLASGITSAPLQEAAGMIVVPFEKSITTIGLWLTDINKSFQEKQDLIDQNEELKNTDRVVINDAADNTAEDVILYLIQSRRRRQITLAQEIDL